MKVIFGRRVAVGWNGEATLRFGIYRDRFFTAYGFWPLLVGVENRESAARRKRIEAR